MGKESQTGNMFRHSPKKNLKKAKPRGARKNIRGKNNKMKKIKKSFYIMFILDRKFQLKSHGGKFKKEISRPNPPRTPPIVFIGVNN